MHQSKRYAKLLLTGLLTLSLAIAPATGLAAGSREAGATCGGGYSPSCVNSGYSCDQSQERSCNGLIGLDGRTYGSLSAATGSCSAPAGDDTDCSRTSRGGNTCGDSSCAGGCAGIGGCDSGCAASGCAADGNYGNRGYGDYAGYLSQLLSYLWGGMGGQLTYADLNDYANTSANQLTTAAARPIDADDSLAQQVVDLVNDQRAAEDLSPLSLDDELSAAAAVRSGEISSAFSHTRPDGSSCFTALDQARASYSRAGENIALGQQTAEQVVEDWMNSPGHRSNIMNPDFTRIGVAVSANTSTGYGYAWAQFFAD